MRKNNYLALVILLAFSCSGPSNYEAESSTVPDCENMLKSITENLEKVQVRDDKIALFDNAISMNGACEEVLLLKAEWGNSDFETQNKMFKEKTLEPQVFIQQVNYWKDFYQAQHSFSVKRNGGLFYIESAKFWDQMGNEEKACQAYWKARDFSWKPKDDPYEGRCSE